MLPDTEDFATTDPQPAAPPVDADPQAPPPGGGTGDPGVSDPASEPADGGFGGGAGRRKPGPVDLAPFLTGDAPFDFGPPKWDQHDFTPGMWSDDPDVVHMSDFTPGEQRRFQFLGHFEQLAGDHEDRVGRPATPEELGGFADIAKANAIDALPFTDEELATMNGGSDGDAPAKGTSGLRTLSDAAPAPADDAATTQVAAAPTDASPPQAPAEGTAAPAAAAPESTPPAQPPQTSADGAPGAVTNSAPQQPGEAEQKAKNDGGVLDWLKGLFGISSAEAAETTKAPTPEKPDLETLAKPEEVPQREWDDFKAALRKRTDLNDHERYAFLSTFGYEGGTKLDRKGGGDGNPSSAGIAQDTLRRIANKIGVKEGTDTADLTMDQRVAAYKYFADEALKTNFDRRPSGVRLDAFGDPKAAAQFFDTIFQTSPDSRADIVQKGINATIAAIPEAERVRLGLAPVTVDKDKGIDGNIGAETRAMMLKLAQGGYSTQLRANVGIRRDALYPGGATGNNKARNDATR